MNPHVTQGGYSSKAAYLYFLHDKKAKTRERVGFFQTCNMYTDDPDKAWKVMAYTINNRDRLLIAAGHKPARRNRLKKPLMSYSLNFHPDHPPSKEMMLKAANASLTALSLQEHEAYIVEHTDEPHKHVHVVVNRVHPVTGVLASNSKNFEKLSEFALKFCREHGIEHLAPKREENAKKRDQGEKTKHHDPRIQNAWDQSHDGPSLIKLLQDSDLFLAHGNTRIVVVDTSGKVQNPVRQIPGIRAKDFRERLSNDFDLSELPYVNDLVDQIKVGNQPQKINVQSSKPEPIQTESVEPKPTPDNTDQAASRKQIEDNLQNYLEELKRFYRVREHQAKITHYRDKIRKAPWWRKLMGLTYFDKRKLRKAGEDYAEIKEALKTQVKISKQVKHEMLGRPARTPSKMRMRPRVSTQDVYGNSRNVDRELQRRQNREYDLNRKRKGPGRSL